MAASTSRTTITCRVSASRGTFSALANGSAWRVLHHVGSAGVRRGDRPGFESSGASVSHVQQCWRCRFRWPLSSILRGLPVSRLNSVNPNFRNAYTESFNLNLQQAGPAGIVFSAGYYGSVGKAPARPHQPEPAQRGRQYVRTPCLSLPAPSILVSLPTPISAEANSVGFSNYNALWLTATKNCGSRLQFNMNYNWSKSMDSQLAGFAGGLYVPGQLTTPANNYGPSDFDTRNHYAATAIYNLPFKGNRFVEGFQLSTIVAVSDRQSGQPHQYVNVHWCFGSDSSEPGWSECDQEDSDRQLQT